MTTQTIQLANGAEVEVLDDPYAFYAALCRIPKGELNEPPRGSDEHKRWQDELKQLSGRERAQRHGYPLVGASFAGLDYSSLVLDGLVLIEARFDRAIIHGMTAIGANLDGANFTDAKIDNADLTGASFRKVILSGTSMRGAKLHKINAESTVFFNVDLTGADLRGAQSFLRLVNCTLKGAAVDDNFADRINVDELAPYANIARALTVDSDSPLRDLSAQTFRTALKKLWLDAALEGVDLLIEPPIQITRAALAMASRLEGENQ